MQCTQEHANQGFFEENPVAQNALEQCFLRHVYPRFDVMEKKQDHMVQMVSMLYTKQGHQDPAEQQPAVLHAGPALPSFEPPLPPDQDVRKDGQPRQRRQAITWTMANAVAVAQGQEPQHLMAQSNLGIRDFWEEYQYGRNGGPSLWLLEVSGSEWRWDHAVFEGEKPHQMRQAWNQRKSIYDLIVHHMKCGLTEEEALCEAEKLYETVEKGIRSGRSKLRDVNKVCRAWLEQHEEHRASDQS